MIAMAPVQNAPNFMKIAPKLPPFSIFKISQLRIPYLNTVQNPITTQYEQVGNNKPQFTQPKKQQWCISNHIVQLFFFIVCFQALDNGLATHIQCVMMECGGVVVVC